MILLHVAMSLDGFIAGSGGDMSWTGGADYDTSSAFADEMARGTGAVLAGRGWYDVASSDTGGAAAGIYGGAWSGPVVVVTHRPDELASAPGIETAPDLDQGLARARYLAGDQHLSIFGGDLARQVLARDLLDEIAVQIVPIVLGGGTPLFGEGAPARVTLERTHLGISGPLTDIRFRVLHRGAGSGGLPPPLRAEQ